MALEKKEIQFTKEIDDVMVLLVEVVKTIKNKGEYSELIDELVSAVNGADEVLDEAKNHKYIATKTVLDRAVDIAEVLIESKED